MKIKEIPHGLDLAAPTKGYVRSPGLHASEIYGRYYAALNKPRFKEKDSGPDKTKMELGTSFEEILEPAIKARLLGKRPGEFTSPEGIIFSPDWLFFDNGELVLGEFKLTYYSSKGAPKGKKFERWLTQIKMYCHWLEINRVWLFALFINGDYRPSTPQLKCWELVFTDDELAEEHGIMIRFAKEEGLLNGEERSK